jgi:endonuclease/exonuclease/phosphatase family metal-dependent hydrolase
MSWILVVIIIYLAVILVFNTILDYKPLTSALIPDKQGESEPENDTVPLGILSWNIGYGGLGKASDFFYDGGSMTRPGKDDFTLNWQGILSKLASLDTVDFLMLQEVDTASYRSYGENQYEAVAEVLEDHGRLFAKNYDVAFVPLPVFRPMARVTSGLAFFSRYFCPSASMVVFPGNYSWPMGLFMPDRCFIKACIQLPDGKKLVLINTHNSAFDDGALRNRQLEVLYTIMQESYEQGDYVIAGGDWNMNPAGFNEKGFLSDDAGFSIAGLQGVSGPDTSWTVAYDPAYPTNRDVSGPYSRGNSPTTIIDFFICSPNIDVLESRTLYNHFEYSDHHPVYLRFSLNN